jgi:hypothetical protein
LITHRTLVFFNSKAQFVETDFKYHNFITFFSFEIFFVSNIYKFIFTWSLLK